MIPALCFVPLSDVESALTLVIDQICQNADQFDIPTHIIEKIDEIASYFQKTYNKRETIGRQQRNPSPPPLSSMESLLQRGGSSHLNNQCS